MSEECEVCDKLCSGAVRVCGVVRCDGLECMKSSCSVCVCVCVFVVCCLATQISKTHIS